MTLTFLPVEKNIQLLWARNLCTIQLESWPACWQSPQGAKEQMSKDCVHTLGNDTGLRKLLVSLNPVHFLQMKKEYSMLLNQDFSYIQNSLSYEKSNKKRPVFFHMKQIVSFVFLVRGIKKNSFLISAQCTHTALINANGIQAF